jgi:hypothetical protein
LAIDKKKIGANINVLYANNEIDDLVEALIGQVATSL